MTVIIRRVSLKQGMTISLWENRRHQVDKAWEIILRDEARTIKRCFFSGTRIRMDELFSELQERYSASQVETL